MALFLLGVVVGVVVYHYGPKVYYYLLDLIS